ncbi:MAG: tRNA (adenosine(37)-N6)-threonylcarbamoyltransferase complex dimerization subunit type 1 TsaB [Candidatus Dadabacteria bacterium]|nr:tRNA (adenosine(37)-N6)-threonylcarbamoyltransferase complex dimerization subunit type 1 TsaB [Candidatus Dadabacteria bacterium]NIS08261.1 tRNA (adenosine(37)-N6)-threonylcarbamoyltransferase complex dimerization subunit type 1 TsaB [Candidatus Dadabacteria bacterium]NIY21746.1 tRNA (adenosine(37)-N6)-threonylcarbamoyltransferase complex dimerization subunit type 1 TsaB [Candidatus Dadabacteria bacterium]
MIVLGIETSSYCGSVAVAEDDKILGELFFDRGLKHSSQIIPSVKNLLSTIGLTKTDLEGIAVSEGPGSYTSLRVGISAAKGLAYSLDLPLTGVSTLKCLAFNSLITPYPICSIVDAKKRQLYSAFFRYTLGGLERVNDDIIISMDDLCTSIEQKNEKIVLIGDVLNLNKSTFMDRINGLVLFAPGHMRSPRASSCAILGVDSFKKAKRDEVNTLVPKYIREADAELIEYKR